MSNQEDITESPEPDIQTADGLEVRETALEPDEDGFERLRIDIWRARPDRRLDKYLAGRVGKSVSRTAMQGYIREGNVTVNGKIVKPSYVIRANDVIEMLLPAAKPREIPPEPIPLNIVYEDDDILAVNKQAGLIVHPARGNWTGTLVNALAYYFKMNWRDISELPTSGEVFRPGIVHRLDRDTTGIMLVAKTELALWRLGMQFEHRGIHKTYSAIVSGLLAVDEDIIDMPIGKHPKIREKYAVHRKTGAPYPAATKEAITRYKAISRLTDVGRSKAKFTLVELYPQTGRTHQLRVHMSAIGHPMIGDRMYGGGPLYRSQLLGNAEVAEGPLITRQALHAHTIEFRHPRSNEIMTLEAPWPQDFVQTLDELNRLGTKLK
ncbi:MAG: RluA family pseudouridine synthase [Planctomycetes bacterium]|jgi:23S rRNA pseudouridine1911/1915/1917 synthase|nr:RluA family pseudouridine synthase [Planctomycetota bacterium]